MPKIDFSEEKCHAKCLQKHFWAPQFQNFQGGMPPDPLAAHAFGARNLPCLVLKSGYGPESYVDLDLFAHTNICRKYLIKLSIN